MSNKLEEMVFTGTPDELSLVEILIGLHGVYKNPYEYDKSQNSQSLCLYNNGDCTYYQCNFKQYKDEKRRFFTLKTANKFFKL